jgi:hypothetical protein
MSAFACHLLVEGVERVSLNENLSLAVYVNWLYTTSGDELSDKQPVVYCFFN